jgi:hypothetical protein
VLTNYLGPCDTLGRYLVGDVVTFRDIITDQSPFAWVLIPDYHHHRLIAMLNMTTPRGMVPATPYPNPTAHQLSPIY